MLRSASSDVWERHSLLKARRRIRPFGSIILEIFQAISINTLIYILITIIAEVTADLEKPELGLRLRNQLALGRGCLAICGFEF